MVEEATGKGGWLFKQAPSLTSASLNAYALAMQRLRPSATQLSYIAFATIIVFVLSQIIWWAVFQRRYIHDVRQAQNVKWQQDIALANDLLAANPAHVPEGAWLEQRFPELELQQGTFSLKSSVETAFKEEQDGYVRMFTYEAPFFAFLVLLGAYIIFFQLRAERRYKKQQQNFLNAVSHEFKTPISTLKLLIQSAQRPQLQMEKKDKYIEQMAQELSRLELTSGQVLAAARLERSLEAPVLAEHDLNTVVRNILQRLQAGLEARGAVLEVDYSPYALPVSLNVDAFTVVLSNLLDNAVKYNPRMPKAIRISFASEAHLIHMHVDDAGVGISDAEAARIFHRFYRIGDEMTRQSQGVGLGLYLVKQITETMRGWVKVSAREEQGSRFSITLPRRVTVTYCSKVKAQQHSKLL